MNVWFPKLHLFYKIISDIGNLIWVLLHCVQPLFRPSFFHSFEFSTQNSIYIENNILMSKMYEISFQVRVEHVHDTPEAAENFLYETLGSSLLHHRSRFLGHKRTKNLISLQLACHLRRFLGLFGLSWDKSWAFHPSLNLILDIKITKS